MISIWYTSKWYEPCLFFSFLSHFLSFWNVIIFYHKFLFWYCTTLIDYYDNNYFYLFFVLSSINFYFYFHTNNNYWIIKFYSIFSLNYEIIWINIILLFSKWWYRLDRIFDKESSSEYSHSPECSFDNINQKENLFSSTLSLSPVLAYPSSPPIIETIKSKNITKKRKDKI